MTKPLQPIYLCMYCGNGYSQQTTKLIARCGCVIDDMYPWPLIPHYSLPDLEKYLDEKIKQTKDFKDGLSFDEFHSEIAVYESILKDLNEALTTDDEGEE